MSEQGSAAAHSCVEPAGQSGKWSFGCACHSSSPSASRRQFLAGAAAFSATAVLPAAKTPARAATQKLIDTHHHFYPPTYQKAWADWEDQRKIPHFGVQLAWTRDKDIEEMDKQRRDHQHPVAGVHARRVVRHRCQGGARHGAAML